MKKYIFLISIFTIQVTYSITWFDQAQRIQEIVGGLGEFQYNQLPTQENAFAFVAPLLYVPTIDGTVGSKIEEVDSPPIHFVPMIAFQWADEDYGFKGHIGYLPNALAQAVTENELNQYHFGLELAIYLSPSRDITFFLPLGFNYSMMDVKGSISSVEPEDTFDSSGYVIYTGFGMEDKTQNTYMVFLYGMKSRTNEYYIYEDETQINVDDDLSDTGIKGIVHAEVGANFGRWQVGLYQQYTPDRLASPGLRISYVKKF